MYISRGNKVQYVPDKMMVSMEEKAKLGVSIIIPVRNEEGNILDCLNSLSQQDVQKNLFEVIIVNDHSTDNTLHELSRYKGDLNVAIYHLENEKGKKAALELGIQNATSNLVLTTDADCIYPEGWVRNMLLYYRQYKDYLIAGPVYFIAPASIWQSMLYHEQLLINGMARSTINLQKPLMCSGANLMFEKQAFEEVGGYAFGREIASGDDVFLLHSMHKKFKHRIGFNNLLNSHVSTKYPESFKAFLFQRLRWAGKTIKVHSSFVWLVGLTTILVNSIFIANCILSYYSSLYIILLILKVFVDIWFFYRVRGKNKTSFFMVVLLSIFYPLYSVLFASISPFISSSWKGRPG